jgi:predicted signal transduction protein with EAL and GGDEF domain
VILVGTASDRAADFREILEAGADDYIVKPYQKGVLDLRLVIARQLLKTREERRSLEDNLRRDRERLKHLATHDPLTNLLNRAAFQELLENVVEAARTGASSALLYFNLDNALDVFGTCFSSFTYLKNLFADYLKIDGSFVRDAETGQSDWTFVELINHVAHWLKIKSIAEFVEQEATLAKLRAIGVDFAQGYFFGKPGPAPS